MPRAAFIVTIMSSPTSSSAGGLTALVPVERHPSKKATVSSSLSVSSSEGPQGGGQLRDRSVIIVATNLSLSDAKAQLKMKGIADGNVWRCPCCARAPSLALCV